MSDSRTTVTIVVPCRNERQHIEAFLADVFGQDFTGIDYEVVVADGMSDDGTAELLRELARKHRSLDVVENRGRIVSTGLNEAIRRAKGDVIIRMDVHARYAPDYVQECIRTLRETGADNVGGPHRAMGDRYLERAIAAAFHSPFAVGAASSHDINREGLVDTVFLGCWKKQTLLNLGLFDEALVRNQDDELNYRLVKAGGSVFQSPRIQSWYWPRNSFRRVLRQYFQYGFWKVAVMRKHGRPAKLRHLVPGMFCLSLGVLPLLGGLLALLGHAAAARALLALFLLQVGVYGTMCLIASAVAARRDGWRLMPGILCAIPCFHFGYGLGFLAGLVLFSSHRLRRPMQSDTAFSGLSR